MYGSIEIEGRQYQMRQQTFNEVVNITANGQILANNQMQLPGVADFLLLGLTRGVIKDNLLDNTVRFLFRLGNTDGNIWYNSAGNVGTNNRILDTLTFGDGRFPYPISPGIFYGASSAIPYEIQDISQNQPYVIHIGFQGAYLVPMG